MARGSNSPGDGGTGLALQHAVGSGLDDDGVGEGATDGAAESVGVGGSVACGGAGVVQQAGDKLGLADCSADELGNGLASEQPRTSARSAPAPISLLERMVAWAAEPPCRPSATGIGVAVGDVLPAIDVVGDVDRLAAGEVLAQMRCRQAAIADVEHADAEVNRLTGVGSQGEAALPRPGSGHRPR